MCTKRSGGKETNGNGLKASLRGFSLSRTPDASTGTIKEAERARPSRQFGSVCPPNSRRRSLSNLSHTSAYPPTPLATPLL